MSATRRWPRALGATALALGALLPATAARAQSLEAAAGPYAVQRRVWYHGDVYDQAGTAFGASAVARWGRFSLGAAGWSGSFAGRGGLPNGDARVRTTAATLHVAVTSAFQVGAQLETRRFSSEAGVTLWQLKGWDVLFHPELGLPGLRGVAEVVELSSSRVRGGPAMNVALQTTMGFSYAVGGTPIVVRLAYRFERYDLSITGAASERLEQFRGVIAEAGVRLARPPAHPRPR